MAIPSKNTASSRIFYGWYVMAGGFLLLFFQSGARFSFGIMFKPMMSELGWNRATISSVFFLNMVIFALALSAGGKLYDRYGPRWVIFGSTVLLAGGYMCTALVHSLWQFYLFYGILTAAGTGGASVPLIASLMSKWFEKHRGLAISLAISGTCLGQFALVPIFNQFVLYYSWRIAYLFIGLCILVINTFLAFTVIRGNPVELGFEPYGHKNANDDCDPKPSTLSTAHDPDLNLSQAMKTYSFWLFLLFMFICGSGDYLVATHLVPFVTDYGVSPTVAANMLAIYGLMGLGGILVAGPASDLIGNKIPIALTFVMRLLLFALILKYQTPLSFYIFAAGFGFTWLVTAPLTTTLVGRLYGFSHVGMISGFITTVHHLGGGFWSYMGGLLYDKTGSYQTIFILSAISAAIAVISAVAIKEKNTPVENKGHFVVIKTPKRLEYRKNQNLPRRHEGLFRVLKILVRLWLKPFFRVEVGGLQNLPRSSAFILLSKHQRWEDIPLLSITTPRPLYYIAKFELFKNALSNRFFSALGGIPLNRSRPLESRRFLQATIQLLEKGEGVVIFPEGTYYRNKMGPGQTGMIKFVLSRLTLPFIPVGINYAANGWRTRVRINFGKAFHTDPTVAADSFVRHMMKEIAVLSGLPID